MTSFNIYFTGFNGFGQLKNLPKVIESFEGLSIENYLSIEYFMKFYRIFWPVFFYRNKTRIGVIGENSFQMFMELLCLCK